MGVTGLWRLIEPAGKPVPVETLENKVLAVDISIWLHQMVKGYQDAKGAPLANAHLMGLFQRLCKLLYFRIKPIFVFDGAFPELKKETIAKRQDSKAKYHSESERLKRELALLLSKKTAVSSLLGKQISPKKGNVQDANSDDIFKLPALPEKEFESDSDSDEEDSSGSIVDLHSVDIESENFKSLPVKDKYNLLLDLKETRKMNSWGKLHELPKKSDNFSDFQMQRLLKRRKVQECLQETEKEMGDVGMSLNELESFLNEEGIDTKIEALPTRRIASDNTTRILMINNVKQALEDARKRKEALENPTSKAIEEKSMENKPEAEKIDELQDDIEKAIQMSLECANEADLSACTSKTDDSWTTFMTDSDYSDSEDNDGFEAPDMASAKAYIMQYSDFTYKTINDIVGVKKDSKKTKNKPKLTKAEKIIQELNKENTLIADKVDLSSSDEEDCMQKLQEDSCCIDIDSTSELDSSNVDATQASVVCVENPTQEVISLDSIDTTISSLEDTVQKAIPNKAMLLDPNKPQTKESESSSSDDEFEEVPLESEFKKPVVQLTLNMNSTPDEEDIFADVFTSKENVKEQQKIKIETEVHSSIIDSNKLENVIDIISGSKMDKTKQESNIAERQSVESHTNKKDNSDEIIIRPSTSGVKLNQSSMEKAKFISNTEPSEPNVYIDEEDELQKAIQMSLQCVEETDSFQDQPNLETESTVDDSTMTAKTKPPKDLTNEKLNILTEEIQHEKRDLLHRIEETDSNKGKPNLEKKSNVDDSTMTSKTKPPKEPITTEQLNIMSEEIEHEEQDLIQEKGRLDRIGRNITEQMTKEAQELLQIFGIPYIVAPMEAEAQCAFLESVNLTDGTITDDSDIWLFGGRTVYKNFFNQKKHVLQFLAERIERSFNLTREQLVLLALLVGSDYTTGVTGVGPVTALEILASFPFNKKQFLNETTKQAKYSQVITGLQEFKQWVKSGKRTDNTTLKKKLKNVDLNEDFPSVRVVQAYLEPNVEKSEEKFTWGELDLTILRDYAKAKFGWSQSKLDEIIKPVLKRLQDRKSQRSVQDYFKRKVEFQPLHDQVSKRIRAAIQKMGPENPVEESLGEIAGVVTEKTKPERKRKLNKNATKTNPNEAGPSKTKLTKNDETDILLEQGVTVVSQIQDGKSGIDIKIPKTDRFQEIIPQREKDKQSLLQNKMKAIEIFRKTKIDKKKKVTKKRVNVPKEKAELSEASDTD